MITIVVTSEMLKKTLDACPMFFWGEVFPHGVLLDWLKFNAF
jgi:hypothetical protein